MVAQNILDGLYDHGAMMRRAEAEAEMRFRVSGDVAWTREASGFELPEVGDIVRAVKYQSLFFRDDGGLSRVDVFVTTSHGTVAVIRLAGHAVRVTAWGDGPDPVAETVRYFLGLWPVDAEGAEIVARQYV